MSWVGECLFVVADKARFFSSSRIDRYVKIVSAQILKKFIFIFVVFLSACRTLPPFVSYSGERLPKNVEARILGLENKGSQLIPENQKNIFIICVNGKSTEGSTTSGYFYKYPFEAFLQPGANYVGLMYGEKLTFAVSHLWFEAEAGGLYQAQVDPMGRQVRFSLLDVNRNTTIGVPAISRPSSLDCQSIVDKVIREGRPLK